MGRICERLSERLVRAGAWETAAGAHATAADACETAAGASEVLRQCNATVRQFQEKHHHSIEMHRVN